MFCNYTKKNNKWICKTCGRITPVTEDMKYMPMAKCRVPEGYKALSDYVHNFKLKGVGDCISEIVKKLGYEYPRAGSTRFILTKLNTMGIDWCKRNQDLICSWFKHELDMHNIEYRPVAIKAIVRLAVINASNQDIKL